MRYGLLIFGATAFLIANTYHDGKYVSILKSWKKYYQMAFIGFLGLSAYLFIRKHPTHSQKLLMNANELIKYMPIDKEAGDLLSPIFDFSTRQGGGNSFMPPQMYGNTMNGSTNDGGFVTPQQKRMMNSGKGTKRSVSETKKKFVAAQQGWKCGKCDRQLSAWFEVDHKVRLEYGGTNEVSNLVALCRECHGEKTAMENL